MFIQVPLLHMHMPPVNHRCVSSLKLWATTFRLSVLLFLLLLLLGLPSLGWLLKHKASKHSTPPTQSPIRQTCSENSFSHLFTQRLQSAAAAAGEPLDTSVSVRQKVMSDCVPAPCTESILGIGTKCGGMTKYWKNCALLWNKIFDCILYKSKKE